MASFHILNGDALASVFPEQLTGERIIARECLVDGDVSGDTIEQLFATRSAFMDQHYGDAYHPGDYERKSIPEFEKISAIAENAEVTVWFEDDLFCQVNLWFVLHLLHSLDKELSIYLVRPTASIQFGFGGMSPAELVGAFEKRMVIPTADLNELKMLWHHYQKNELGMLEQLAMGLNQRYPFLLPAVKAHIERQKTEFGPGRPEHVILEIMDELKTQEFGKVFREFCKREPIYGFGDLQVERMWKKIIEAR